MMSMLEKLWLWKYYSRKCSLFGKLWDKIYVQQSVILKYKIWWVLACVREGKGNPLQCSCLENARDGGAWWAAVYGVAQSRTWLNRLSSSSSSSLLARVPFWSTSLTNRSRGLLGMKFSHLFRYQISKMVLQLIIKSIDHFLNIGTGTVLSPR